MRAGRQNQSAVAGVTAAVAAGHTEVAAARKRVVAGHTAVDPGGRWDRLGKNSSS